MILPFCWSNIWDRAASTLDSLLDIPSLSALVLSLSKSATPFSPKAAILCRLAIGPIGVRSNLKSPVVTIVPFGVWITIPCESGIEWVVLTNSTVIVLNLTFVFSSKTCKFL